MRNTRKYGSSPYEIAVLHGGPGAVGDAAPLAKELSRHFGVLEPLQTRMSVLEQIDELKEILEKQAKLPVTLIGHSWGGMLTYAFTAHHPTMVKKLILVSSGAFDKGYAESIIPTHFSRMTPNIRENIELLSQQLFSPNPPLRDDEKNQIFTELGRLFSINDSYDLFVEEFEEHMKTVIGRCDVYESVWADASALRESGELLNLGNKIKCPVVAIHGDYDSHPAKGVEYPLSRVLNDFRFILLENCGHYPWFEKQAKGVFFEALRHEITT